MLPKVAAAFAFFGSLETIRHIITRYIARIISFHQTHGLESMMDNSANRLLQ